MKKIISVCIPCRNELGNIKPMAKAVTEQLMPFKQYEHEIIFIDNCSDDGTQDKIREVCAGNKNVKAILNAKNFPESSGMHVILQAPGDCIISIPADFQVPPELIPDMIKEWEKGAKVVALMKTPNKRDKIRLFRKLYYTLSKRLSEQDILPGFTGSGMYDKSFIDICKSCKDPLLSIHYMVSHFAAPLVKMQYNEQPRLSGKSNHTAFSLVDVGIKRFISISTVIPHLAILVGMLMGFVSGGIGIYYFIRKLLDWDNFLAGIAPLVIGVFMLGSVQLIILGLFGEYIMIIDKRQKNEPRVIEHERLNFDDNITEDKNFRGVE